MMGPEELIRIMQTEGAKNNPPVPRLATMTGPRACSIGDLHLDESDLLFFEHLLEPIATKVSINESLSDMSTYAGPLQAGDVVAVMKMGATKYLVLGKVAKL